MLFSVVLFFTAYLISLGESQAKISEPKLLSDTKIASAGYFKLSWELDADRVVLQESSTAEFTEPVIQYHGPDRAALISGKSNGTWYYRVRSDDASAEEIWSQTVAVTVRHHELSRAWLFFGLGLIVFLATLFLLIREARKHR